MMPYFYSRRVAAAGMFAQGAIGSQDFQRVESLFMNFMAQVGNEITHEEQVKFQEDSLEFANEFLEKYIAGITRESGRLLIGSAKQGISIRDALLNVFQEVDDELAEIVAPAMCRDWIMKPEYCMGFFATGWWRLSDSFEATSEKIIGYLRSTGLELRGTTYSISSTTTNIKVPHFYLRGMSEENLNKPIHIHFDSFEPSFAENPNAGVDIQAIGSFLVTVISPNFGPTGLTCRVSGINHTLTHRGVVDGVIAHVDMVKDLEDHPLERVYVKLLENDNVIGHKEGVNGDEKIELDEVFFSHGETVYLDGIGKPFDEMDMPQPTQRQRDFADYEESKRSSDLLESILKNSKSPPPGRDVDFDSYQYRSAEIAQLAPHLHNVLSNSASNSESIFMQPFSRSAWAEELNRLSGEQLSHLHFLVKVHLEHSQRTLSDIYADIEQHQLKSGSYGEALSEKLHTIMESAIADIENLLRR